MADQRMRGFTLVEMLVVMAILSILAMVAIPSAEIASTRTKERELRAALLEIRKALDAYKRVSDEAAGTAGRSGSGYPPDLTSLVVGFADPRPGAQGRQLYFLRRVPRDPFAPEALPAVETWGLRSYASPPDDPKPGADVYDVYSLSKRVGINGQPLAQW